MVWLSHVDAFTDRPFSGNPAAVCGLAAPPPAAWMQSLAAELHLPATAFVWPLANEQQFGLRWFAPAAELALCGHGTLAAAHALLERNLAPAAGTVSFQTAAGPLLARRGAHDRIQLDFPAEPSQPAEPPPALLASLAPVIPRRVERNRFDYLVELDSEAAVQALQPDLARLRQVPTRGLIVTAQARSQADFVSRFFAPSVGLDEDHVTGSAHCCLGPYWQRSLGPRPLVGLQLSPRGGTVHVEVHHDRVHLAGHAITILTGELAPPPAPQGSRPARAGAGSGAAQPFRDDA